MRICSNTCYGTNPPEDLRKFREDDFPGIASEEDRIREAEAAGYTVTSTIQLPMKAWEDHYQPVAARINEWREICGCRNSRIPAGEREGD